jgi:hypothetical protein
MSCEQFKTAINDAAMAFAELQGPPFQMAVATGSTGLLAHLQECAVCRERYDEEQRLCAAIDAGLSRLVNAEIHSSFLPRVRAAVEAEGSDARLRAPRGLLAWRPVTAAAFGLCLVMFFATRFHLRGGSGAQSAITLAPARTAVSQIPGLQPPARGIDVKRYRASQRGGVRTAEPLQDFPDAPVMVPPEEREALARFVAHLPGRRETAIATRAPETTTPELAEEPLGIADLKVAPLDLTEAE